MTEYSEAPACRACGARELALVLDLGEQFQTGVFPRTRDEPITCGPLRLVKCVADGGCGLLQLQHSFDAAEMYGDNYGYRSGLNPSMVAHLHAKIDRIRAMLEVGPGDLVIDIGSNDGTTLRAWPAGPDLVGVDPTSPKFREFFPSNATLIPDFFTAEGLGAAFPGRKARVITSFSMFYDLEDPLGFMRDVAALLADDGVWVFEQSYMPAMLQANSYDTVCHEHLEFYALHQVAWMAERAGLTLLDVEFNAVNGGSFSVTAGKRPRESPSPAVAACLARERDAGLHTLAPYRAFAERVATSRLALGKFVRDARAAGKRIAALGASTKGNVLLQYCGFSPNDIDAVGEVNLEKVGRFTPGSLIPIVHEDDLLAAPPDYLLVLPWHFRSWFLAQSRFDQCTLVFPLPELNIVPPRQ